ncbi:hypothetical protein BCR36DRAFT_329773 [Piromyces finnis]|uniref:G-protein coupled receptors family 1 profile domain-containing protein n=1 Tax=Piromyces finnis TaxID=1754191 RepID=A0A1Y1V810_9FUNG|nr:hypothetical protein BCR36DRAFT_329773 [Piromyces finnis]|eukprot:ORX48153.1 hypothetical protein BCR36DRAFT_329773 [Piromyces finnis]
MDSPILERITIIEHTLSLVGVILTLYFNSNPEIIFLCSVNMCQHLLKIIRLVVYGFEIKKPVNPLICYIHSFCNNFTLNISLTAACLLIFTLYAAIFHNKIFSRYYKQYRFFIYLFIIIYTTSYIFAALYEPIIMGYSKEHIEEYSNCTTGYRYRLYQFVFISSVFNLPFTITTFFCSIIIVYKIFVLPRPSLKRIITKNTKMSFSRWIKILFYTFCLTILSFINIYSETKKGIESENGVKEIEKIDPIYLITASSGILIFLFTNSFNQIKRKLGGVVQDDDSVINYNDEDDDSLTLI